MNAIKIDRAEMSYGDTTFTTRTRRYLRIAELAFFFIMLLIFFGFFWSPTTYFGRATANTEDSDVPTQIANLSLIVFLFIGGLVHRAKFVSALLRGWPILAILILALCSAFWSDDPLLVVRRAGVLALSTLMGIYLFIRLEIADLSALLVKVILFMSIISLLIVFIAPGHGLANLKGEEGAWRGAFLSKNSLGYATGLGTIVSIYAFKNHYGSRVFSAVSILLTIPLTVLSGAKGAIVFWPAALYVAILCSCLKQRSHLGLLTTFLTGIVGIAGIAFVIFDYEAVLSLLQRDATLTGRIDLWRVAVYFIQQKPWLGYGFGSFWRSNSFEAHQIWATTGWDPMQAHNGWLELGLNLGLIGIAANMVLWGIYIIRGIRLLRVDGATHVVFCLVLLITNFVANLSEAQLWRQMDIFSVIFIIGFLHLDRERASHRKGMVSDLTPVVHSATTRGRG